MPPPSVCNSSPLIALHQIDQLGLLQSLFPHLVVPPAVVREIAPSLAIPEGVDVQAPTEPISTRILLALLGPGESEAISLAAEISAPYVLLDDRPARRLAEALGLQVIGTLGILLAAKRRGLIDSVRSSADALILANFRIAPNLYRQVLADAGETP